VVGRVDPERRPHQPATPAQTIRRLVIHADLIARGPRRVSAARTPARAVGTRQDVPGRRQQHSIQSQRGLMAKPRYKYVPMRFDELEPQTAVRALQTRLGVTCES
jgi:hypothetical protein